MINRRSLITGLIAFGATPAIVKASSLMPVKVMKCDPIQFEPYYDEFFETIITYNVPKELFWFGESLTRIYYENDELKVEHIDDVAARAISWSH